MRFACPHCKTKYQIPAEKLTDGVVRVRCKTCQKVIAVRKPAEKRSEQPLVDPNTHWHFVEGEDRVGPKPLPELEAAIRSGRVAPDSYAWKPGMESWQRIQEIPALQPILSELRSTAPAPTPPSLPAPEAAPARSRIIPGATPAGGGNRKPVPGRKAQFKRGSAPSPKRGAARGTSKGPTPTPGRRFGGSGKVPTRPMGRAAQKPVLEEEGKPLTGEDASVAIPEAVAPPGFESKATPPDAPVAPVEELTQDVQQEEVPAAATPSSLDSGPGNTALDDLDKTIGDPDVIPSLPLEATEEEPAPAVDPFAATLPANDMPEARRPSRRRRRSRDRLECARESHKTGNPGTR